MNSTVFKYKHHYQQQQQHQHFDRRSNNKNENGNGNGNNCGISSHNNNNNNNNQNSIFILNTATNNILSNNPQLYYSDLCENNVVSSLSPSASAANSAAPSSVWSSTSSTICSPAAHALQKLFNCSSSSFKFNHGYNSGIESKPFKSKSEILKKKSKFWKYLEDEDNDKNNHKGIDDDTDESHRKLLAKGFKFKSSTWSKSFGEHTQEDLSELLEHSCSLCDNCRCVDCQIGYFDCENSDDSGSEYSFHLSAYEEDEEAVNSDNDNVLEHQVDLKSSRDAHHCAQTTCKSCGAAIDAKGNFEHKQKLSCCAACCDSKQPDCTTTECCQQCLYTAGSDETGPPVFITAKDH